MTHAQAMRMELLSEEVLENEIIIFRCTSNGNCTLYTTVSLNAERKEEEKPHPKFLYVGEDKPENIVKAVDVRVSPLIKRLAGRGHGEVVIRLVTVDPDGDIFPE